MEPATYTRYYGIGNVNRRLIQRPEIPFQAVTELSYTVTLRTFPLLESLHFNPDDLSSIRRFDTLGSWKLSYQEILRHLSLAKSYTTSPIWDKTLDLIKTYKDEIVEAFDKYFQNILNLGDWSIQNFEHYVKEHEDSASPFGMKWGQLLDKPANLKLAHERVCRLCKQFIRDWKKYVKEPGQRIFVNPAHCYPALRARPGEATLIDKGNDYLTLLIRKWRDRKVGGIAILSQVSWAIFQNENKKKCEKPFYDLIATLHPQADISSLARDGPKTYKFIIENNLQAYDLKTAEKQIGLAFNWLPFMVDLGHPQYPGELSAELYSGVSVTGPCNDLFGAFVAKVQADMFSLTFRKIAHFSDNWAFDLELPDQNHFEKANTFCGWLVNKDRFGPVSLVTDNPSHAVTFTKNEQIMVQTKQYIMKPLMGVVMNGIADYRHPMKFLDFVIEKEIFTKNQEFRSGPKDALEAAFYHDAEVHESFRNQFNDAENYVNRWFLTQDTNAESPQMLTIY